MIITARNLAFGMQHIAFKKMFQYIKIHVALCPNISEAVVLTPNYNCQYC